MIQSAPAGHFYQGARPRGRLVLARQADRPDLVAPGQRLVQLEQGEVIDQVVATALVLGMLMNLPWGKYQIFKYF